jgi:hypothetical protein
MYQPKSCKNASNNCQYLNIKVQETMLHYTMFDTNRGEFIIKVQLQLLIILYFLLINKCYSFITLDLEVIEKE